MKKTYVVLDDEYIVAEIEYHFSPFVQGNDESLIEVAIGNALNSSISRIQCRNFRDEKWVEYPYKTL